MSIYTENEKLYLKHKIMKQTSKVQIKTFFQLPDSVEMKPTIKTILAKHLEIKEERLDELYKKDYKKYYEKFYTKMEDSFKSKYRLFIFSVYLKYTKLLNFEDINFEEFNEFKITNELIEKFAADYYQGGSIDDDSKSCEKSITEFCSKGKIKENPLKDKYMRLKYDYISNAIENNFTLEQWKSMYKKSSCAYCGVKNDQIEQLRKKKKITSKSGRGFNLEVDRMSPNLEYSYDNCCMSCYWCNNAKTDEFLPNEFKEIARGINKTWNNRMKKSKIYDTVIFPEDSNVWNKK